MYYISTRGDQAKVRSVEAIIKGLAEDRGLFVPVDLSEIELDLESMIGLDYKAVAKIVLAKFLTDFTDDEIAYCVDSAYDDKFDSKEITPIIKTKEAYFLELYHGKTAAFKDMALSILPHLLMTSIKKTGEKKKVVILTATSGDTGKAALAGFADVEGTEIFVFYPKSGVSAVQERQMVTQAGDNVHVYGITGNFDDAQTGVKDVFNDRAFEELLSEKNLRLSSANSINIGRLVPQVAYYVNAYLKLREDGELEKDEKINICVPTGNFGNILAAYYAREMGVPVNKFICASNENKVLTDFINTGEYDAKRDFILTTSPSMDILISSNLERLIYHLAEGNSRQVASLMRSLDGDGFYEVTGRVKEGLLDFFGGYADMPTAHYCLAKLFEEENYLIDTHTAVGYSVYLDYVAKTNDKTKTLIASTASAYKFAGSVASSLGLSAGDDEFDCIKEINEVSKVPIPEGLMDLDKKEVLHGLVIEKEEIKSTIESDLLYTGSVKIYKGLKGESNE